MIFQTAAGVSLPFPEQLHEAFQCDKDSVTLNLSFEKLADFMGEFIPMLEAPLFLALHVPFEDGDHLYYLDGCTHEQMQMILDMYGELLRQDGICCFAIASHATGEELYLDQYKVIRLYSPKVRRFLPLLARYGLTETQQLVTAWDTISQAHPGQTMLVELGGQTVFSMLEELKQIGLYQAHEDAP